MAKSVFPAIPMRVRQILRAASDKHWARGTIVPINSAKITGQVQVAHCVGFQWVIIDSAAVGAGCLSRVPSKIAKELGVGCI